MKLESKEKEMNGKNCFEKLGGKKRTYIPILEEKRQELLSLVENEGISIKNAAKKVGINYSAAKSIVKVFKETGRLSKLSKKHKEVNVLVYVDPKTDEQKICYIDDANEDLNELLKLVASTYDELT
jgi:predicted transcriptional regulator